MVIANSAVGIGVDPDPADEVYSIDVLDSSTSQTKTFTQGPFLFAWRGENRSRLHTIEIPENIDIADLRTVTNPSEKGHFPSFVTTNLS